ncbi:MAG: ABC transporter substrate-binding protein [Bdellovibrionales bacterium]|nr:ABC transporter substrate-binding protein [Ramlibacter sp.]
MSQDTLTLSLALSDNERTRPILQGRFQPQGVRLIPTAVHPSEMFWRQLKYADFDVSEMSLSSLFIATARGDRRWVALPIYTSRMFFHTNILVRTDRGIASPEDLKGKRVGVPEYQQTAALWSRGILEHEFGVKASDIEWFMERGPDKSHGGSTGFKPPEGVRLNQIPPATNIGEMLSKGELDATLLYLSNRNLVDRSTIDLDAVEEVKPLFRDKEAETRRYFAKTGIFPINHTVVIRRELYERHPWLALNLYHAFMAAKQHVEHEAAETLQAYFETGLIDVAGRKALQTADPKAYGMKASRKVIETISKYVHEQGLTGRRVAVEELFAPSTLDV